MTAEGRDRIAARTGDRIRRQAANSGGFRHPVQWSRLDHERHHPGMAVTFLGEDRIAGRERRQTLIAELHPQLLDGVVVDVGCDRAHLRRQVEEPGRYLGIDLFGDPDIRFDLLSGRPLPLRDRGADAVVCTDVLEHLHDPHFYCDELFRVADRWVLIGLPNCWTALTPSFADGKPAYKNYGLPPEAPGDAHRWTFATEEAIDFALYRAAGAGFRCRQMTHFTTLRTAFGLRWIERGTIGRVAGKVLDEITQALEAVLDRRGSATWLNRHVAATWWLFERRPE